MPIGSRRRGCRLWRCRFVRARRMGMNCFIRTRIWSRVDVIKTPPPRIRFLMTSTLLWRGCSSAFQRPRSKFSQVLGFCFGGHVALIAAILPGLTETIDFYGADVNRMRPGEGPPSLELLAQIQVRLTCICGSANPLILKEDRRVIESQLKLTAICTKGSDIWNSMVPTTVLFVKSEAVSTLRPHPRVGSSWLRGN